MSYITSLDITDALLKETAMSTVLTAKLVASDVAVEDMAIRKGVAASDIKTDPVHYLVKEWAKAWVGCELYFDLIGKGRADTLEADIYNSKHKLYVERLSELEAQINYEVLVGQADEQRERPGARTGTILFG